VRQRHSSVFFSADTQVHIRADETSERTGFDLPNPGKDEMTGKTWRK